MSEWSESSRRAIRAGLAALAIPAAGIGVWATFAPRSFNDDFPGAGREWVAPLGPYNEHLVRDVGAFELGLVALAAFAIVTLDRRAIQAALLAYAVSGLPHLIFHLTETAALPTLDNVVSLGGLALPLIVPALLLPRMRTTEVVR